MKWHWWKQKDQFREVALNYFTYTLSLPERTIRSLASLAGGATTLLTETILPESIRNTTIYNVSLGMMQRFIIEKVADMNKMAGPSIKSDSHFLLRKMAGTTLEAVGLMTIRVSPLWVFAIISDAMGGGKKFLERLISHLKKSGIIAQETRADDIVDLLHAIQEASNTSAISIDIPPLSRDQLIEITDEMKKNYRDVFETTSNLFPGLDEIWESMISLSKREKISLDQLGGIVAMEALKMGQNSINFVSASARTGNELLNENILKSYRQTLSTISEKGVNSYMNTHMDPFLRAAKNHFSPHRKTWVESFVGKIIKNHS